MTTTGESRPCSCCGESETSAPKGACPACGGAGKPVQSSTMRALLDPRVIGEMNEGAWRFCEAPGCDVVYFSPETAQTFRKSQLTVRVGIKEIEAPHPLCYCFGHSLESLRTEWEATGHLDSVEAIRTAVKEGRCRCDQMNPSGACCLGDVVKAAKKIQESSAPKPGKG